MDAVAAGTVITKSHLPFGRVLANSFRQLHPDIPFFVALVDEVEGCFDPAAEPFPLLRLEDLPIPNLARFRFHYTRAEAVMATKPYVLSHLLDRGFDAAIYLDADILVLNDLMPVLPGRGRSCIVLTPHLLKPLTSSDRVARELGILASGVCNGGFVAVSATRSGRAFLTWWQNRLYDHCRFALDQGMQYDQRWLDLAPVLFDEVSVLRDPGCNVAYWNLPERAVRFCQNVFLVDGQPCRFFHFSGFDPDLPPENITRYTTRLTLANVGPAGALYRRYRALLEAAGYHQAKNWPYAYACFDNGVPISDQARQVYGELGDAANLFGDPLQAGPPHSFFRWFRSQQRS